MSHTGVGSRPHSRRRYRSVGVVVALAASLMLAACGSGGSSRTNGAASSKHQLLLLALPFACDLNDYASNLCKGAEEAARSLPHNYTLQIKTTIDYTDVPAFNSMLQTSLQLNPTGLMVFPNGPAAQTPVLNEACARGVKVVFVDTAATGVRCALTRISSPNEQLGADSAKWLIAHPPASGSKEVAIVSQKPGEFASNDERVTGFTRTVEAAGYKIVATLVTTNALDQTRGLVTNALTAHPHLGAIFSANGPMGDGTSQALKGNKNVVHMTLDGNVSDVKNILAGTASENTAFSSFRIGELAVRYVADAIAGKQVPKLAYAPTEVVDATNAKQYIAAGGLR
jgi:ribose transport system substrate-binding protein